ncbi:hypothetical protein NE645_18715, partial [Roseburia hominis]|nr:hypothetical protein [Roseburia hominis]
VSSMPKKPFTDEQRSQIMVTSVGKLIFNGIMPEDYYYINEPTNDNLLNGVPDKYFLDKGEDIHAYLENAPLV